MYGSVGGSISGVLHMVAKRPYISAAIAVLASVAVATSLAPPPPPTPPPPPAPIVVASDVPFLVAPPGVLGPALATTRPVPTVVGYCDLVGTVVNNVCKAHLDDAALRLRRDPGSTLVVSGTPRRAAKVKRYLTSGEGKAGIDPPRITLSTAGRSGDIVELVVVPAGAAPASAAAGSGK